MLNRALRTESSGLCWFKASHSSEQGGDCLEVAYGWRKSSYSSEQGGACVEVAYMWRKSSYSTEQGGNCLEVATHPHTVHLRDSKNPGGPVLTVAPSTWRTFTRGVGGKATD